MRRHHGLAYGAILALLSGLLGGSAFGQAGSARVYVEDSPAAQQLMRDARQMLEADRPNRAARQLQRVIDRYPHKLLRQAEGLYMDATQAVRRRIVGNERLLTAYQQVFTAKAQRALKQATTRRPTLEALEQVQSRYPVTEPALEAGLIAAGLYLERGEVSAAAASLEQLADHPALADHRRRYHRLQAVLGALQGRTGHRHRHQRMLRELGAGEAADAVTALAKSVTRLEAETDAISPPDLGPEPTAASGQPPLWQVNWLDLNTAGVEDGARGRTQRRGQRDNRPALKPSVAGSTVYLNTHRGLYALDRISGRLRWRYQPSRVSENDSDQPPEANRPPRLIGRMRARRLMDAEHSGTRPRGVLVSDRTVYAILGLGIPGLHRGDEAAALGSALCAINRETGRQQWRLATDQLPEAIRSVQFYGTPRQAGERLFVLGERGDERASTDVFLIAVDRQSGEAVWHRHVASLMAERGDARTLPIRLRVARGRVFLCGPFGTAAAVEPRTGTVQWIRVASQGGGDAAEEEAGGDGGGGIVLARRPELRDKALIAGRPVLVEAGLIVPRPFRELPPLLLDPATGKRRRPLDRAHWSTRQQLVPVGSDVLALAGDRVTRIDGKSLEARWQHELESPLAQIGLQPAVTGQYIALLTQRGLLALGLADGGVRMQQPLSATGHLAAHQNQLLVADNQRVRSYMSWSAARDALHDRISRNPADPAPALSLAHLAIESGHAAQADDAARQAVAALQRLQTRAPEKAEAVQPGVFRQLLVLARGDSQATDRNEGNQQQAGTGGEHQTVRRALFKQVATVAESPRQQVAYHLALGRLQQRMGRHREAVTHFQTVLTQPRLAEQRYAARGQQRHAGLEARSRLRQMIDEQGQAIYQQYEQRARQQLEQARARREGVAALRRIATRYPFARAATAARYQAAERLIEQDQPNAAMIELRRAYQRASTTEQRARIVSRLARLHQQEGRPDRARRWLEQVRRQHPDLQVPRRGKSIRLSEWINRLTDSVGGTSGLARLTRPFSAGRVVEGRLLERVNGPADGPANRVLVRHGRTITLYQGRSLTRRWQAQLPGDVPGDAAWQTLQVNDQQAVLWSPEAGRLLALRGDTGERAWPMRQAEALLNTVGKAQPAHRARTPEERRMIRLLNLRLAQRRDGQVAEADRNSSQYRVASTPSVIILIGQYGRVVGLARHTGEVLWRLQVSVQRVSAMALSNRAVAIAGLNGVGTDAQSARIILLDPITGERLSPPIDQSTETPPHWLGMVGDRVVAVSPELVKAYRIDTAEALWEQTPSQIQFTDTAWAGERWLGVVDTAGRVQLLDPDHGERLGSVATRAQLSATHGRAVDDRGYVRSPDQARAIAADGTVIWRDAISLPEKRLTAQAITRGHVVLAAAEVSDSSPGNGDNAEAEAGNNSGGDPARAAPDGEGLYLLDRDTGRIAASYNLPEAMRPAGDAAERVQQIRPFAGGLAISDSERTLLLPGSAEAP